MKVSYVYPNVSEIAQRGGLLERWHLVKEINCDYIEIPADFIKNKTEIGKTGLNLGDFLSDEKITAIYNKDVAVPKKLKYILHTEPSLRRNDGFGLSYQAPLKWYDHRWVQKFVNMIIYISRFFGVPPNIIEIHPGDRRNSFDEFTKSLGFLCDSFNKEFGNEPLILIENRTQQFISSGKDILGFWRTLSDSYSDLKSKTGIILDVQQLYTTTKKNFLKELEMIPVEALKGFHIHYKHRAPELSNEIQWAQFFSKIRSIENDIIINPEVLHKNNVINTINFCNSMLHQSS